MAKAKFYASKKRVAGFLACIFALSALLSFAIWPIEKYDQTECKDINICAAGKFTSEIGGGLLYSQYFNEAKTPEGGASYLKEFKTGNEKINYTFAPLVVFGMSVLIGLGVAGIAGVFFRKARRDLVRQTPAEDN